MWVLSSGSSVGNGIEDNSKLMEPALWCTSSHNADSSSARWFSFQFIMGALKPREVMYLPKDIQHINDEARITTQEH